MAHAHNLWGAGGPGGLLSSPAPQNYSRAFPFVSINKEVKMAVAASRTQIIAGEDHAIAIQREVMVDPESGVAVQVEKAVIAVDLGDGRVAVHERQRLISVQVRGHVVAVMLQ